MYFVLASAHALLGLGAAAIPRLAVTLWVTLFFFAPSSTAFDGVDYRIGLYAYDYFFLAFLLSYPLRPSFWRLPGRSLREVSLLFVVALASLVGFVAYGRAIDKYVLRDVRPFLLVLEGLAVFQIFDRSRLTIPVRALLLASVASSIGAFVGFALIATDVFPAPDEFYFENRFRYLALGSYGCAAFLVWASAQSRRLFRAHQALATVAVTFAIGTVVLAGVRGLVLATALGCVIATGFRGMKGFVAAGFAALLVAGFAYVSVELGIERVTAATSSDALRDQLAVRFGPAVHQLVNMNWWEWVVGKGVGVTFEIPWFEYRNLDTRNNFVDSTYITVAIKFGAAGVLYLWLLLRSIGVGRLNVEVSRALVVFIGVLSLTMAIPYQKFSIAIAVMVGMASCIRNPCDTEPRRELSPSSPPASFIPRRR